MDAAQLGQRPGQGLIAPGKIELILLVATMPIHMGKVIPAKPGEKGKAKNLGSLMRMKAREASTHRYRIYSKIRRRCQR